jgi:hypothetical protein
MPLGYRNYAIAVNPNGFSEGAVYDIDCVEEHTAIGQ